MLSPFLAALIRVRNSDIGFEVLFFLRLFNSLIQTRSIPITLLGYEPANQTLWVGAFHNWVRRSNRREQAREAQRGVWIRYNRK
jgi:hypothetical protein